MPLIDSLPLYSAITFSVFFFIVVLGLTLLGTIWKLNDIVIEDMNAPFNGSMIAPFFGPEREMIRVDFGQYSRYNEFLGFLVKFRKLSKDYYLGKDVVSFEYHLAVRNSVKEDYIYLVKDAISHTALNCPRGTIECKPMHLYYLETCQYTDYRLEVKLHEMIDCKSCLANYVDIAYRSSVSPWLIIQIVFSFIIFLGMLAFTIFYFCYTMAFQKFKNWLIEQWLIGLLLVLFVFYINPFYLVDDVTDSTFFTYIMKFIDSFFVANFVICLYFLMHNLMMFIETPATKRRRSYWIISAVVAVVYWVCIFATVLDYRYNRQLHLFFQVVVYVLLSIQVIVFPFQLFKYVLIMRKKLLTYEKLKRTILIFTICFSSIAMAFLIVLIKEFNDEANKVVYMLLFLLTIGVLAVNYMPSSKEHFEVNDDEAGGVESQRIISDQGYTEGIVGQTEGGYEGAEDEDEIEQDAHVDI